MDPDKIDDVVAPAPASVEPVSQAEDVRNDVAAALTSLKAKAAEAAPVEVEAPADDHPEPLDKGDHPSDPKRYADGTFKPVKQEAAPEKAAAPDPKLPPVDNTAKPSTEQPSTAVGAAPVSWAAEAKASWASLPPAIQNAVLKREAEVSSGFRQKSDEVRRYEQVIAPVAQEAARLGMQPDQAINALMSAHHMLQQDAPAAIARLAQQYGVDLATLASNPPAIQAQPRHDPMVSQLYQTVTTLQSRLDDISNTEMKKHYESVSSKPHFEQVRQDMARIVQTLPPHLTAAEMFEQAYEQAVWVNPEVRAQLIAEQTAQTQQKQAETLQVKAKQAAKAAVSIRGASNGANAPKMPPLNSGGDVYDDVRAAIHALRQ